MRSAKSLILILISILLILTGCEFDPDYIPSNTLLHRPLVTGTYVSSRGTSRVTLELGEGVGDKYSDTPAELTYQYKDDETDTAWKTLVTYKGTCTYEEDFTYDAVTGFQVQVPIYSFDFETSDEPDFFPSEQDGWIYVQYDYDTALKEIDDAYDRQALRPRNQTIVHMTHFPGEGWEDHKKPGFVSSIPFRLNLN